MEILNYLNEIDVNSFFIIYQQESSSIQHMTKLTTNF